MPARKFWNTLKQKVMAFKKNFYGRWNLGPLPPAGNQESKQGMAPYLLNKTEKIPHTTIWPSAGQVILTLLGWTRGNLGALHAQVEHCDQCNLCRSKDSPASCNQFQKTWTSDYTCFAPTWQCSAPYCPFNCCDNPRSVLRVSVTSAVLARPRPPVTFMSLERSKRRREASLSDPTKRCSRQCTSGCALSQKNLSLKICMQFRNAGTVVWNAMGTT